MPARFTAAPRFIPLLLLLAFAVAPGAGADGSGRTFRVLFLEAPDSAPRQLHLFDGSTSTDIDLPLLNLSRVYPLGAEVRALTLLPNPPNDPGQIPADAPAVQLPAGLGDFYLLLTSDPSNRVAPVRMRVIPANIERVRPGGMQWFNLTELAVGGNVGSRSLSISPGASVILDPPAAASEDYPVKLSFRISGNSTVYPLCETTWRHDPRSRSLAFIVAVDGTRSPRVLVFPDFRPPPSE